MSVPAYQVLDDSGGYDLPPPDPTWFDTPPAPSSQYPFPVGGSGDYPTAQDPTGQPTMPSPYTPGLSGYSGTTDWGRLLQGGLGLASGIVGINQANQLQQLGKNAITAGDPFGPYRGAAAQQLMSLMADPSQVTKLPGYQFMLDQGLQAVGRGDASKGLNRSGNMDVDLLKYGEGYASEAYQQQIQQLSAMAGVNFPANPGPGLNAVAGGTNTLSSALAALGYGAGQVYGGIPTGGGASAGTPGAGPSAAGGEAAGVVGDVGMGLAATRLGISAANTISNAATGSNAINVPPAASNTMGELGSAIGIYQGLEHGGVTGDTQAAASAVNLATQAGVDTGVAGVAAGYVGPALSLYNFATNWKSGAGGADALSGAETGASIGSMVGPWGTLIGAVLGGVVGGVSSAFGPGREDPENVGWDQYAAAYDKDPRSVSGASPAQLFQSLAGIFDTRGSSIPFYNQFGRMGETKFTQAMTDKINTAVQQGQIGPGASAQDIYTQVIQPWVSSMSPGGWKDANTVQGNPTKGAVGSLLTGMIQNYITGQSSGWQGIGGQPVNVKPYTGTAPVAPMVPSTPTKQAPVQPVQHTLTQGTNLPAYTVH